MTLAQYMLMTVKLPPWVIQRIPIGSMLHRISQLTFKIALDLLWRTKRQDIAGDSQ